MNEHFQIDETTWQLLMDKLDDIHGEVKRTNGRVSNLERWQSWIKGALALFGVSLPILGFFLIEIYKRVWK